MPIKIKPDQEELWVWPINTTKGGMDSALNRVRVGTARCHQTSTLVGWGWERRHERRVEALGRSPTHRHREDASTRGVKRAVSSARCRSRPQRRTIPNRSRSTLPRLTSAGSTGRYREVVSGLGVYSHGANAHRAPSLSPCRRWSIDFDAATCLQRWASCARTCRDPS